MADSKNDRTALFQSELLCAQQILHATWDGKVHFRQQYNPTSMPHLKYEVRRCFLPATVASYPNKRSRHVELLCFVPRRRVSLLLGTYALLPFRGGFDALAKRRLLTLYSHAM